MAQAVTEREDPSDQQQVKLYQPLMAQAVTEREDSSDQQ